MEQRPLRLGDTVDDYCTRERRVTNHVIVAIVGDAIRHTRCTTCDTEHPFKGAKEPRLRKKPGPNDEVPANAAAGASRADEAARAASTPTPDMTTEAGESGSEGAGDDSNEPRGPEDGWPAHRTLIRATLPRTENDQPTPRPIPEFTMHQRPQGRGGHGFRHTGHGGPGMGHGGGRGGHPNPNGNGNVNGNGPERQGGGRRHRRRRPR